MTTQPAIDMNDIMSSVDDLQTSDTPILSEDPVADTTSEIANLPD